VTTAVTAASVLSVAASHIGSPESAAVSGAAGSTTSGSSGSAPVVVTGSAGHAVMTGTPWRVAVLAGALLVFLAGLATILRGARWPVMSARYDLPQRRGPARAGAPAGPVASAEPVASAVRGAPAERPVDSASMWESLSGGEDPTADA
jgi:Tryptophan-associated transmembrane protein (Trp_oprn_chp)